MMVNDEERVRVTAALQRIFADPTHGQAICDDLCSGLRALPIWMQEFVRRLLCPTTNDMPNGVKTEDGLTRVSAPPSRSWPDIGFVQRVVALLRSIETHGAAMLTPQPRDRAEQATHDVQHPAGLVVVIGQHPAAFIHLADQPLFRIGHHQHILHHRRFEERDDHIAQCADIVRGVR